jgi:prophage maintenance system killer protein
LTPAVNRPFQTFGGVYLHQTLAQQAASLFHSFVCNHCFNNGNKRTAVMALDMFMTANHRCLLLGNEDVYELAKDTAESNLKRISNEGILARLASKIDDYTVLFELLKAEPYKNVPDIEFLYQQCLSEQERICKHPLNHPQPGDHLTLGDV